MAVIAALVLVPTMAWAQGTVSTAGMPATERSFMVEIYAGGGGATTQNNFIRNTRISNAALPIQNNLPGNVDAYFLGGLKLGYWFTPYGTAGITSLPDWMKYLGFYFDFSYQKLNFSNSRGTVSFGGIPVNTVGFDTDGSLLTFAFMFAGRYGFMPDSEVPFGRLQPYIAAGPAIFVTNEKPTFNIGNLGFSPNNATQTNVGLAVETGLRYFFTKAISTEVSFKYRYATFSNDYTKNIGGSNIIATTEAKGDFNLLSAQIGVAYHF
jgi:opacity protein-like surface antigen